MYDTYWSSKKRKKGSFPFVHQVIRRHQVKLKYLGSVAIVEVSEPLNVIEKQPGEGYESENYE